MEFKKYQHLERFGTDEVDAINFGECYVFPKLDGTNGSIWLDNNGQLQAGSRNRKLSLENDNAGFLAWATTQSGLFAFLRENPYKRLFGEWLVPHSLKTYRDGAWKKFYVFDVMDHSFWEGQSEPDQGRYMHYLEYKPLLEYYGIEYIPPLAIITNGDYDQFIWQHQQHNDYLIKDGHGKGEGVVLKNYSFVNKYGRTTWAKIVTSEFKEVHRKHMGAHEVKGQKMVEEQIVEKYVTKALVDKTFAKINVARDGWKSQYIPELLNRVFHDLVTEETWHFVKEHKNPRVDFKTLNHFTVGKIKEHLPEVF